jgi:hypothetical protein
MINKKIAIVVITVSICIVAVISIAVYFFSTHYIFNLQSDSVGKIVYCTNTNISLKSREHITVTDKEDIQKLLNIYKGTVFKQCSGLSDGSNPNIEVFDKNNKVIISFSSANTFLFNGDKQYSNSGLSQSSRNEYNRRALEIFR